ncbi:MAG: hypothetical protein Kow009_05960 [Spirochaetales bacterium]
MKKSCIILVGVLVGIAILVGSCDFGGGGGGGDSVGSAQPTAKWFIEKGPPSNAQGSDGDLWLDTDAAILYVKTDGAWVAAASVRGPAGSGWLFGSGAPASSLGSDGDLYLDTSDSMTYRKLGGAWSELFPLQGTQWYSGASTPDTTVPAGARTGDYYFQTSTATIYRKDTAGWSSLALLDYTTPSFIFTPNMQNYAWGNLPFNAVAYGGGVYVAVGDNGLIARSMDGTTWNVVNYTALYSIVQRGLVGDDNLNNFPIYDHLEDIAYGNGVFVAIGGTGIYTSSDGGVSWQEQDVGEYVHYYCTFLNGSFYISGYTDHVFKSTDGVNWTAVSTGYGNLGKISYGNGRYISFYYPEGFGGIVTSTDGVSWSLVPIEGLSGLDSAEPWGIVFGAGLFVAIGDDYDLGGACIWISQDGIQWSSQDLPLPLSTVSYRDITFGNGFAIIGYDSYSEQNLILTSPNGISWSIQTLPYGAQFTGIHPCSPGGSYVIATGMYQSGDY